MKDKIAQTLSEQIREICRQKHVPGLKIQALKAVRELTGLGLMHAKLLVECEWEVLTTETELENKRQAWLKEGRENGWL